MNTYDYILVWAEKTAKQTVVGKSETDVWRSAAKIWFPHMAIHDLLGAVKLMRQTGGHILRRKVRVS